MTSDWCEFVLGLDTRLIPNTYFGQCLKFYPFGTCMDGYIIKKKKIYEPIIFISSTFGWKNVLIENGLNN